MHVNRPVGTIAAPHGGDLVDLLVDEQRATEIQRASRHWPSWNLTPRQLCDLELLSSGAFSPLRGFMTIGDYESVVQRMRLRDGTLWPMPITLDVTAEVGGNLKIGETVALRDPEGVMLAALRVESIWTPDRLVEARGVYGTTAREHPGVGALLDRTNPVFVGGPIEAIQLPTHYDYRSLRRTPADVRADFGQQGWTRVVAFQTCDPMHRAQQELTLRSARDVNAKLLIHPVVGMTTPGDVDHYTRVRCYESVLESYPADTAMLSLLPLATRMGGPREAVWHAIIRKNFGCTHLIVGRDHAGPGNDSSGKPFYGPHDARELLEQHHAELGIEMVPVRNLVYVRELERYVPEDEVPSGSHVLTISGPELRGRLARGEAIPAWFSFPAVVRQLQLTYPPRERQGFTVFFTGLSGSGKSTIANVLLVQLLEMGGRSVTLLDGDLVRTHLSSELGFSKEHRDINIRRIGFVASEITKNGGIAICAPIAPYEHIRQEVRKMIEAGGGFVLVHTATPLEICEQRDRKGLYAKARAGLIGQFTGVSDPYEAPQRAEVVIDTTQLSAEQAAGRIIGHLVEQGYLRAGVV